MQELLCGGVLVHELQHTDPTRTPSRALSGAFSITMLPRCNMQHPVPAPNTGIESASLLLERNLR